MNATDSLPAGEDLQTYALDDQIGYLLRLASQRHGAIFLAHSRYGLTPTQLAALMRLEEQGECSQNHIGRLAAMDVATIKGVIDRLRRKSLTQSRPDPNDRRRTLISLSQRGRHVVAEMRDIGLTISRETLAPLTEVERRRLVRLLRKLV